MSAYSLEPLVRRLRSTTDLDPDGARALSGLPFRILTMTKGEPLYAPGAINLPCYVLLEGCISRHKLRDDNSRTIVAFELSGDIVNLESLLLGHVDCGAEARGPSTVAIIEREAVSQAWRSNRSLEVALWRSAYIKAAALEEWLLNIGRRSPLGRLAHLFSELHVRSVSVESSEDYTLKLNVSDRDLADAMGLQQVIVTRSLHELASKNLILLKEGLIVVRDVAGLAKVGDFKSSYLHLAG